MNAMLNNKMWDLKSPSDGRVVETVSARDLWQFLLTARIEVGEPYITFQGNLDKNTSKVYSESVNKFGIEFGLRATQSNMCNEICLKTGIDQHKKERTAVCCLSSLNLEYFDEWKSDEFFIEDIARFLDNVLTDFIDRAPDVMERAKYSAMRERSIGIGVMGWHSFLQSKNTPIESVSAKSWNKSIFKHIREKCDVVNEKLASEKGACPDALELGINNRFSNMLALAPTASISIINNSSPCIEPYAANVYNHKTLSGSFVVRNKYLQKLLNEKDMDTDDVWRSISLNEGSVQHLNFLTQYEKDTFKTFVEVDQMWLIEQAGDRQVYIDQGQSLNIAMPGNEHKKRLHEIHVSAWKRGVKGLYYCRSTSIQRAEKPEDKFSKEQEKAKEVVIPTQPEYDECLACQ
jgi:ribonucleoside-diphosphate reductase alpha chain